MTVKNPAFDELSTYMLDVQKQTDTTAAACYVIRNDTVVLEWYSGRHDSMESSRPVDAESQFNVASVRKTYMAFAVSWLIELGRIHDLDDEIGVYLEEYRSQAPGVTIRHCLTHTHGLVVRDGWLTSSFPPGRNWAYNNVGITILTNIANRLTGKSLADLISELVGMPLGWTETGWRTQFQEHLIYNHYRDPDNWVGPNDSPAGDQSNLFVSARELAQWGNLHLNQGAVHGKQLYPPSIFERITTLQTPSSLPLDLQRNGLIWWLQHDTPANQIGGKVPGGSYQVLGITGCACLVIPQYRAVAVRMYNALHNPQGYDYLEDIREFGNKVTEALMADSRT